MTFTYLLSLIKLLSFAFANSKLNKFDNDRGESIWFFKRFISYYSDPSSSDEEMSQFMRTNEIYGEATKIINGLSTNLDCLRNLWQCVTYF